MDGVGRVSNNAIPCGGFCKRRAIGHQLSLNPCIDGGGSLVWPFTAAQLKELERQAMIYKYMMASLPVPFDLLTPSLPLSAPSLSPYEKVRVGLKGGDMEPGRCRRTDGKKWRCSKEVVANHKYCERHLHRGRSRSRKPVEPSSASPRNRNSERRNNGHVFRASSSYAAETIDNKNGLFIKKGGNFEPLISSSSSYRDSQSFINWEMKGDSLAIIDPPEENWFGYKFKSENLSCTTMNAGEESVNLHSYADIPSCPDFIDIWSNKTSSGVQDRTTDPVSRTPVSSATSGQMDLSLAAEDEMNRIQISLGITGSVKEDDDSRNVSSNWVAPVPPGGPLGEMLWPSFVVVGDGDSCITTGTGTRTMKSMSLSSSPSGVLKQALAFHTDSSSNSSPTQSGRG